jgi:2-polyprenyl-6-methoxyphenol hydroxylase-like FAD-dependent oxidoreductase
LQSDPLYNPDRTPEESMKISEAFFTELKQLTPLAQPCAKFYNADAARSTKLYNWLMRIIWIRRQDLDSSIASNAILLGDAAHAMPIFAGSV